MIEVLKNNFIKSPFFGHSWKLPLSQHSTFVRRATAGAWDNFPNTPTLVRRASADVSTSPLVVGRAQASSPFALRAPRKLGRDEEVGLAARVRVRLSWERRSGLDDAVTYISLT